MIREKKQDNEFWLIDYQDQLVGEVYYYPNGCATIRHGKNWYVPPKENRQWESVAEFVSQSGAQKWIKTHNWKQW